MIFYFLHVIIYASPYNRWNRKLGEVIINETTQTDPLKEILQNAAFLDESMRLISLVFIVTWLPIDFYFLL